MSVLQVEKIRQSLQDVLADHAVLIQVNQFRDQLNIIINKQPGTIAHYAALIPIMRSRLNTLDLRGISRIKFTGRMYSSPQADWQETIPLVPGKKGPPDSSPGQIRSFLLGGSALIALIMLGYGLGRWASQIQNPVTVPAISPTTVTVTEYQWLPEENPPQIVGVVKNYSQTSYQRVQAIFALYDDAGQFVTEFTIEIGHLQPQEAWRFQQPILDGRSTRIRLQGVQAFD